MLQSNFAIMQQKCIVTTYHIHAETICRVLSNATHLQWTADSLTKAESYQQLNRPVHSRLLMYHPFIFRQFTHIHISADNGW